MKLVCITLSSLVIFQHFLGDEECDLKLPANGLQDKEHREVPTESLELTIPLVITKRLQLRHGFELYSLMCSSPTKKKLYICGSQKASRAC